jgi:hypothetical protein
MLTLFNDSEVFQKDRPTAPTELQLQEFYSEKAKEIIRKQFSDSDEEDIIADLKDLYPFRDNGFEMAKELETGEANYDIDTSFCDYLDDLSNDFLILHKQNIKDWIKAHNPQPNFKKGDKLQIIETISWPLKKDTTWYVNAVREETATYTIDENLKAGCGYVVNYEKVEKCCIKIN